MNHPFSGYLGVAKSVDCHSEIAPFQNCSPLLNCPLTRPLRPGEPNIEHGGTLPFVGNGRLMRTKFKVESVPDLKNPLRIVSNPTKMCLMGEYGDSWAPLHKHNLAFPHNNSNITGMPLKDCNSSNLLFVDGHVSLTKYSELADLPEFFYLTGTDQPPRY
jgi:prepilin-type processing-associated H-X9-DG protein